MVHIYCCEEGKLRLYMKEIPSAFCRVLIGRVRSRPKHRTQGVGPGVRAGWPAGKGRVSGGREHEFFLSAPRPSP